MYYDNLVKTIWGLLHTKAGRPIRKKIVTSSIRLEVSEKHLVRIIAMVIHDNLDKLKEQYDKAQSRFETYLMGAFVRALDRYTKESALPVMEWEEYIEEETVDSINPETLVILKEQMDFAEEFFTAEEFLVYTKQQKMTDLWDDDYEKNKKSYFRKLSKFNELLF